MDDAAVVGGREALGDLQGVVDRLASRQRAAVDLVAQRLAFEQLRDDVGRAVLRADVVDGEDVRMVERARGPRLLVETAQPVSVRGKSGGRTLIATSRPSSGSRAR